MFASGSFAIARNKLASARGETDRLAISTVALFELRFGAENSASPSYHHELMDDFVGHLHVLQFGEAAAHSGEIRAALARSGNLIGPYDLLIAGHARSAGLKADHRQSARVQ